jgi:hypothetical protein
VPSSAAELTEIGMPVINRETASKRQIHFAADVYAFITYSPFTFIGTQLFPYPYYCTQKRLKSQCIRQNLSQIMRQYNKKRLPALAKKSLPPRKYYFEFK